MSYLAALERLISGENLGTSEDAHRRKCADISTVREEVAGLRRRLAAAVERARQWEGKALHFAESERELAGILSHVREVDRMHAEDAWRESQRGDR